MTMKRKEEFQILMAIEGKRSFSVDKLFAMLDQIQTTGSISKAAANIDVSYRYAWGLIQDAERELDIDLVIKQVGGSEGGGTSITETGSHLLYQYKMLKQDIDIQLEELLMIPEAKDKIEKDTDQGFEEEKYLLLATTIGPVETGLIETLEQAYYQEKGVLVRHIAAGSGRALDIARLGRVDLVLVHAPAQEEIFISQGFGVQRIPLMRNHFYLVGPVYDPAGLQYIREEAGVTGLFRQIALTRSSFISRGDKSGTHQRELEIWEAAGVTPDREWYSVPRDMVGNQGLLALALERQAYALVDSATYWKAGCQEQMAIYAGTSTNDPLLINQFSLILLNANRLQSVNHQSSLDFANWLTKGNGRQLITDFGKEYGEEPFFILEDKSQQSIERH